MKINGNQIWLTILFLVCLGHSSLAQNIWSKVSLNRSSTYVGQPVEVTITVYTSTWFTSGIDPGNIKVNNAFSVYFRPVSTSFQIKGKTYAGVELIYHVFPFDDEDITFPSLDIVVESPAEGDYKGKKHYLKSKERQIKVLPTPPGIAPEDWLVTTSLSVWENWNQSLKNIKVGDVLVRKVTRKAYGTVAELIPPLVWDTIPGVSLYPGRSSVKNHKSKTAISASRVETMQYLFEKEGEVVIPEMVINWYHPYHKKMYKRTLKEIKIDVQPNPNLGVLTSIRDSLQVLQTQEASPLEQEEKPLTILGYSIKTFILLCLGAIIIFYFSLKLLIKLVKLIKKKREQYQKSEAYYFHHFIKAAKTGNQQKALEKLYHWIDQLHLTEPSIQYFTNRYASNEFSVTANYAKTCLDWKAWKAARKKYIHHQNTTKEEKYSWINPV